MQNQQIGIIFFVVMLVFAMLLLAGCSPDSSTEQAEEKAPVAIVGKPTIISPEMMAAMMAQTIASAQGTGCDTFQTKETRVACLAGYHTRWGKTMPPPNALAECPPAADPVSAAGFYFLYLLFSIPESPSSSQCLVGHH